jgi:hypothetical protein
MRVTYVGPEGWDYKRAIYPSLRGWGMFDESKIDQKSHFKTI